MLNAIMLKVVMLSVVAALLFPNSQKFVNMLW